MACVALLASRSGRISAALLPRCAAGRPPAAVGLWFAALEGRSRTRMRSNFLPVPKGNPVVTLGSEFFADVDFLTVVPTGPGGRGDLSRAAWVG